MINLFENLFDIFNLPIKYYILFFQQLKFSDIIIIIMLSFSIKMFLLRTEKKLHRKQIILIKKFNKIKKEIKKATNNLSGSEKIMVTEKIYKKNNFHPIHELKLLQTLLIQLPFFISAYYVLKYEINFQNTTFYIFGNLTATSKITFFNFFHLNFLPVVMTIFSILTIIIYDKKLRRGLVDYIFPIFFLIILYNEPSSVVLYWTTNNFLGLLVALHSKYKLY